MSSAFARPALLCNTASGSFDPALFDRIEAMCRDAGAPLVDVFKLPQDGIPDGSALAAQAIDLLLVWTGDGTVNAAATAAARWDGALLPLPGGTLNLLSKALHGDRPASDILHDVLAGKGWRIRPPIIRCDAGDAYINIVAGPATHWAEVRETMRRDGLIDAGQAVPDAMNAMRNAPGIRVGDDEETWQAVIMTPTKHGIRAEGIRTDGAFDMLQHGIAWLKGDFRDGPSDHLATAATLALGSDAAISLELDGELTALGKAAIFRIASSPIDFVATIRAGDVQATP